VRWETLEWHSKVLLEYSDPVVGHPPNPRPIDAKRLRAHQNRHAMVRAATDLFTTLGYAGTTMEGVAAGAGMSVQSVYFAFHTKANLLQAAIDAAAPESGPGLMEPDPDRALAGLVDEACRRLDSTGALALAAAAAGPRDAAADEVLRRYETARSKAASDLVVRLRGKRPLATGVTTRRVSDVVYGLLSPQLHALMVHERGWSPKRYAAWATDVIGRALWG
jgi:AcrR family transcriptional regulator